MLLGYYVRNGKGRKQCFFYFNCIFLESRGRGRESEMRDESRSSQLLVYFPNVYNSWDATRPMWEPPTPSAEEQGSNHLNYHRHSSTEHWNLKKKKPRLSKVACRHHKQCLSHTDKYLSQRWFLLTFRMYQGIIFADCRCVLFYFIYSIDQKT